MARVRSIEYDAGVKTKYIQESNGQLTINNSQDVNPLLKETKLFTIMTEVISQVLKK